MGTKQILCKIYVVFLDSAVWVPSTLEEVSRNIRQAGLLDQCYHTYLLPILNLSAFLRLF